MNENVNITTNVEETPKNNNPVVEAVKPEGLQLPPEDPVAAGIVYVEK